MRDAKENSALHLLAEAYREIVAPAVGPERPGLRKTPSETPPNHGRKL
jgi:hypothetical protein